MATKLPRAAPQDSCVGLRGDCGGRAPVCQDIENKPSSPAVANKGWVSAGEGLLRARVQRCAHKPSGSPGRPLRRPTCPALVRPGAIVAPGASWRLVLAWATWLLLCSDHYTCLRHPWRLVLALATGPTPRQP